MNFVVRLLFSGLIALIPSDDGQELTVVLLNAGHAHHLSDGSALPDHQPMLVARAGNCTGQCTSDSGLAQSLFRDKSSSVATDSFNEAIGDGVGIDLTGYELTLAKGSSSDPDLPDLSFVDGVRTDIIPTTSAEREDFIWVTDFSEICPSCTRNS